MVSLIANNGEIAYGIKEWIADSVEDLKNLPIKTAAPGSKCLVTEDMVFYILSNNKTWVPYGVKEELSEQRVTKEE